MSMISENKVYNMLWFQAVWWGMVYLRELTIPAAMAFVVIHFVFMKANRVDELLYSLVVVVLGLGMDTYLAWKGVLNLTPGEIYSVYPPLWLVLLWLSFSCTLRFSLKTIVSNIWLAVPLGALGGAGSYLAGAELGVIEFGPDITSTGLTLVGVWGCLFALFSVVNRMLEDWASPGR